MRIRPAHLILAPFGVLLAGALFMLFSARSAQAAELEPPGIAPGIVTEPVTSVATDLLPSPSAGLSTSPTVPTSSPLVPMEQPALPASPSAAVTQVSQSLGAATDAVQTPMDSSSGLVDPLLSQSTETAGGALVSTNALPMITDTLAPLVNALDGVVHDVGVGAPVMPVLDQLTPAATAPVVGVLEGLGHSIAPPSGYAGVPPIAPDFSSIFQRSFLAPSELSDGLRVRTSTLDARSSGNADAIAAPSTGLPRTSDPRGWNEFVASLVAAASAQGAERAGAGFVFAVLIAVMGLLAGRRRFMLFAQAVQAQRFVSVIVHPG
jgi:hypothetical protein